MVEEAHGGNNEFTYNQQGGSTTYANKRQIWNDVKKLLLNLYNKCTNYIKDVKRDSAVLEILRPLLPQPQPQIIQLPQDFLNNNQNFIAFLNAISTIYETDKFCYQLLFQEADVEEENTIDNINIGFLTGLNLITNQYTYFDFGYREKNIPNNENSIVYKNISINFLLNSDIFGLSDIKTVLYLLGLSKYTPPPPPPTPFRAPPTPFRAPPPQAPPEPEPAPVIPSLLDLINTYFDETDEIEVLLVSQLPLRPTPPTDTLNIDPDCIKLKGSISGIFAIVVLSIMEVLYYGAYSGTTYMFNQNYIMETIIRPNTELSLLNVIHYNDSAEQYLYRLGTRLNYVIDRVGSSIGCNIVGTVAAGVVQRNQAKRSRQRGGNTRKTIKKNKTRTNSKTRKMRKIRKHKFTKRMKKSNRHKRSRK